MRDQLEWKNKDLAGYERYVGSLQQIMARLMVYTAGTGPGAKRTGDPPQGLTAIKNALKQSGAALVTPEYTAYRTAEEARAIQISDAIERALPAGRYLGPTASQTRRHFYQIRRPCLEVGSDCDQDGYSSAGSMPGLLSSDGSGPASRA